MRIAKRRRGAVLILVLVLIPVLALAGYAFTHSMRAEAKAGQVYKNQAQARWLAEAGIQAAMSVLADPANLQAGGVDLYNNSAQFAAQQVFDIDGVKGCYSIVAPDPGSASGIRYGLGNEAGKVPIGSKKISFTDTFLSAVPNITQDASDGIQDFVDADDQPRNAGAESSYYSSLNPPMAARNGTPLAIDELLAVKGMTPALMYGYDLNLDGVQNPSEQQNSSSTATRGLYSYITPFSRADDRQSDGTAKLNLSGGDTKTTVAAMTQLFDADIAAFWVAYKSQSASTSTTTTGANGAAPPGSTSAGGAQPAAAAQTTNTTSTGAGTTSAGAGTPAAGAATPGQLTAISQLIDAKISVDPTALMTALTEAGIDAAAQFKKWNIPVPAAPMSGTGGQNGGGSGNAAGGGNQNGGGANPTTPTPPVQITSPWTQGNASQYLDKALTTMTLNGQPIVSGLMDPQFATQEALQALPGVTSDVAQKIYSAAQGKSGVQSSCAWLLLENVVTLAQFQQLEPVITSAGRVFRVMSVGYFGENGPVARIEAYIDASGSVPKLLLRRDLTPLGNGYPQEMLRNGATNP